MKKVIDAGETMKKLTEEALMFQAVRRQMGRYAPPKGARGLRIKRRRIRARERIRRLQRTTWKSYFEREKRAGTI